MKREFALLEPNERFDNLLESLDARTRIDIWVLENYTDSVEKGMPDNSKEIDVCYVWEILGDNYREYREDYVLDYVRFSYDKVTVVIKPNKWKF